MSTPFHAAWWANRLTLDGPPGSIESLSRSLASARVDLNPHQVDAALFAMESPLQRGALLADEVGLGKTIEAGLVLAQRWAERKRRLLLIVPATLRKQWQQELLEKFHLPSRIIDRTTARRLPPQENPFHGAEIQIASYEFAAALAQMIALIQWDLVILDEAHRLRNVWRPKAKISNAIRDALKDRPKLLLTATPLQNTLLELYGLASLIDPRLFADVESFRDQFLRSDNEQLRNARLRKRLEPICRRTLRRQVVEYVRFTNRVPITQGFTPTDAEQRLYDEVSAYLQREVLYALPTSQRSLIVLILRRLLASSSFAIASTLRRMATRLEGEIEDLLDDEDFEGIADVAEEWTRAESLDTISKPGNRAAVQQELEELREYARRAEAIEHNAKGDALLRGLEAAFDRAASLGASRQAVVFTESRRTQAYLARLLAESGYSGQIVLINGSNKDPESQAIYRAWLTRHRGSDRISGSKQADVKAALVEAFRERTILLATESAAEGINLQFCSLVVNYDLPWNPQRIEQRIGRCHRYGQKHDVVVVNFLNERNAADQRVFQLLSEKFRLFEGIFGASDEILGAVESGIDFERRIVEVYQTCRTPREIDAAFDRLQAELAAEIDETMRSTRDAILEHFDAEVHERLKNLREEAERSLLGHQEWLWRLALHELADRAVFDDAKKSFELSDDERRTYFLSWPLADDEDGIFFHPGDELATELINQASARTLPPGRIIFQYDPPPKRTALEKYLGKNGSIEVVRVRLSARHAEEHLLVVASLEDGTDLPPDVAEMLFELNGAWDSSAQPPISVGNLRSRLVNAVREGAESRNREALRQEELKLEEWADESKASLERELKDLDREIRDARKAARIAETLEGKLTGQKAVKDLEARRSRKRRELFSAQDAIEAERDQLIANIESLLHLKCEEICLFTASFILEKH